MKSSTSVVELVMLLCSQVKLFFSHSAFSYFSKLEQTFSFLSKFLQILSCALCVCETDLKHCHLTHFQERSLSKPFKLLLRSALKDAPDKPCVDSPYGPTGASQQSFNSQWHITAHWSPWFLVKPSLSKGSGSQCCRQRRRYLTYLLSAHQSCQASP